MSLGDYQTQVHEALQPFAKPYWEPLSNLARLAEEVGEVARILNAQYGDKPLKPGEQPSELADELADILFSVICLANSQQISLDEPLKLAIGKLSGRDKDRFAKI